MQIDNYPSGNAFQGLINLLAKNDFSWVIRGDNLVFPSNWYGVDTRDSAGIILDAQSSGNTVQGNDTTYGGDGIFIRSIIGACATGNIIQGNDTSFSPHNTIESWCDRNQFIGNIASDSNYGLWLGGNDDAVVRDNIIERNLVDGISIQIGEFRHGIIERNRITGSGRVGILLSGREVQEWDALGVCKPRDRLANFSHILCTTACSTTVTNDSTNRLFGTNSVKVTSNEPFPFAFFTPARRNLALNASSRTRLGVFLRARNGNAYGWQGNFPVIVLGTAGGGEFVYTPSGNLLPTSADEWIYVELPLAGGSGWTRTVSGTPTLSRVDYVEIQTDTWGGDPFIVDEQAAREDPELAVLSAMAHGRNEEEGPAIARAVLGAARGLDDERSSFYVDLTMASLSAAARRTLEELMKSGKYEYQTEFVRKWVAQGLEQGLEQGLKKGREEGREEVRQEGEVDALFEVLDARGLKVDAEARQQILACRDSVQLKEWIRKAVTVQSVHELFVARPVSSSSGKMDP